MNYFENQMFNPNYINESYYRQMENKTYLLDQDEKVVKALKSFSDMLDQVKDMDMAHQQQAFLLCLAEIAIRNKW